MGTRRLEGEDDTAVTATAKLGQTNPRRFWGRWVFEPSNLTLTLAPGEQAEQEIDLEEMTDSAKLLDRICQVSKKTLVTAEDLGQLVLAINEILDPQGSGMCSSGDGTTIDPGEIIRKWMGAS